MATHFLGKMGLQGDSMLPTTFTQSDFMCLYSLRVARADFVDAIQNHARRYREENAFSPFSSAKFLQLRVKHEAISMICEVFVLLSLEADVREDRIRFVLLSHNSYMDELIKAAKTDGTSGLPLKRVKESKFTDRQIKMTQRMSRGENVEVNERTLGKLLTTFMSFESCRMLVELLGEAGLLIREDFGQFVLVRSPGHLEQFYKQFLETVAKIGGGTLEVA